MNTSRSTAARMAGLIGLIAGMILLFGCGGGGGGGGGNNFKPPVTNTQTVEVSVGPAGSQFSSVNFLFTTVTICVPGSTTQCQTIPDVQVDTGSEGLRLLNTSGIAALNLPAVKDNSTNVLQECVQFADGSYTWGPIVEADIQMAGEKGSGVPLQLIDTNNPTTLPVPADCSSSGGPDLNSVASLGANGIIGVGLFRQDCGGFCTTASNVSGYPYYLCPNGNCSVASVPLLSQLQNPVWTFPQDNNGLLITLPSVPELGSVSVSGSMIFGIGTQSDNALGSATVLTADGIGNMRTNFNNTQYGGTQSSQSYIDSGSNGLYILDTATLNIPTCTATGLTNFYCPTATTQFTATNLGQNGNSIPTSFSIANTLTLLNANSGSNWAFNDYGGPNPASFDYGLPFFFGRTVFVGIEGQAVGSTSGPLWAY